MSIKRRVLNVLIALDQLLYVLITLGSGFPDETLSSAAYRLEQRGHGGARVWRPVIDWLFRPIEPDHCYQSYMAEVKRLRSPMEHR